MVGDPPYRVCIDAGIDGFRPLAGLCGDIIAFAGTQRDVIRVSLQQRKQSFRGLGCHLFFFDDSPCARVASAVAGSPQLLLSIHGNSAPEGSTAAGFECYPSVPGRTWHQESYYFAQQLAQGMQAAGAKLRGHGGIRYIYYQGEVKQLVESTHTEVRDERSFTLLEDVNCPAVLAEQCFVTSEEDVAQFGSEEGCKTVARAYYEAICAYFGTQPLDTPL